MSGTNRKIGLALGSGSARGWAHLGVLEALHELDIPVDCVAGTSIGALVGGVHAAGATDALREVVLGLDWKELLRIADPVLPRSGLLDGRKVLGALGELVPVARIEDLPTPFRAVATDLFTGEEREFASGDLLDVVRASISVPGLFTPVEYEGRTLVDGGLVNPVPVSLARSMGADIVIAVDINHYTVGDQGPRAKPSPVLVKALAALEKDPRHEHAHPLLQGLDQALAKLREAARPKVRQWVEEQSAPRIYEVLLASLNIVEAHIGGERLKAERPEVLLRPRVGGIRFHEYQRGDEAMAEGYREAMAQLEPLRAEGRL